MVDGTSEPSDVTERLVMELLGQRELLEERKRDSYKIGVSISALIAAALLMTIVRPQAFPVLPPVTLAILLGSLIMSIILLMQFHTLRQEIHAILPEFREPRDVWRGQHHHRRQSSTTVNKIYDVNKNTIDKLYDKLDTFSKTWLAVAGGIASGVVVEIMKSGAVDFTSAAAVVLCSTLLWSIAQNVIGVLDYDLSEKTKDLGIWWLRITTQGDRPPRT